MPGLALLPAAHDAVAPAAPLRSQRKVRWLAALRSLPADYAVIDVGSGHSEPGLDLMLAADIPIAVTVPEPPAIETTYRFLRVAFRRRLRRLLLRDKLRTSLVDRALIEMGRLPSPIDLVHKLARIDRVLSEIAWAEAQALRVQLVVNQTRVRMDTELGAWMSSLVSRHYGVALDELGHIEHDDTVWLTVRRNKPLLVDSPASKSARNVERIARRVLALATSKVERMTPSSPAPLEEPTLYAVLGVTRSASDEEIRRAYKRQREIYTTGGLATVSLLDAEQLTAAQRKLDEAYDTFLDAVRRRAYDLSTFPSPSRSPCRQRRRGLRLSPSSSCCSMSCSARSAPTRSSRAPCCERCGSRKAWRSADLCAKTKIGRAHLQAIEDERFDELPAVVYTRGFLVEFAKQLSLDPIQVHKPTCAACATIGSRGAKSSRESAAGASGEKPRLGRCCSSSRSCPGCARPSPTRANRFGTATITTTERAASRRDSAIRTTGPSPAILSGTRGATIRSATVAFWHFVSSARCEPIGRGVANALVGAAVAVVTWALARHALSSARARVAGLIVALHPGLILYAALVMTEPLAALLTLSAFWLAVRDARAFRGIVVGSLVLGVAALIRPQALLCAPFMAVLGGHRTPARLRAALAACLFALVPVLPWTARN